MLTNYHGTLIRDIFADSLEAHMEYGFGPPSTPARSEYWGKDDQINSNADRAARMVKELLTDWLDHPVDPINKLLGPKQPKGVR